MAIKLIFFQIRFSANSSSGKISRSHLCRYFSTYPQSWWEFLVVFTDILRATFCNHRESPDNFFELLIISPKIPFDELFLKTILKTSSDIYFFENFRKSDRAPDNFLTVDRKWSGHWRFSRSEAFRVRVWYTLWAMLRHIAWTSWNRIGKKRHTRNRLFALKTGYYLSSVSAFPSGSFKTAVRNGHLFR